MNERDRDGAGKFIVAIAAVNGGCAIFYDMLDLKTVLAGALVAASLAAFVRGRTPKARLLYAIPASLSIIGASVAVAGYLFMRGPDILSYELAIPIAVGCAPGWLAFEAVKDTARFADGDLKIDD